MMSSKLRIIFMGTPDFAVPCLEALLKSRHDIVGVVSQPNRRVGRGRKMSQTPVAALAEKSGCVLYQWPRLNNDSYAALRALEPDLAIVVAYGKILPQRYLDLPPHGCLNVHSSLLPCLRGAAPIQWSVIRGHTQSGVSIMRLDAGMDTGDVAFQTVLSIGPDETAGELHDRLAPLGAEALMGVVEHVASGTVTFESQDHELATHAPRLAKKDGAVDWAHSAVTVHNHIRGMSPWPGAYVEQSGGPIKIHSSRLTDGSGHPGTVIRIDQDGPVVACADGSVCLTRLQRPGKRPVGGDEYARGVQLKVGQHLVKKSS